VEEVKYGFEIVRSEYAKRLASDKCKEEQSLFSANST
jgi:hypothetical protein